MLQSIYDDDFANNQIQLLNPDGFIIKILWKIENWAYLKISWIIEISGSVVPYSAVELNSSSTIILAYYGIEPGKYYADFSANFPCYYFAKVLPILKRCKKFHVKLQGNTNLTANMGFVWGEDYLQNDNPTQIFQYLKFNLVILHMESLPVYWKKLFIFLQFRRKFSNYRYLDLSKQ